MTTDSVQTLIQHIRQRVAWEKELDVPGYAPPVEGKLPEMGALAGSNSSASKIPPSPFAEGEGARVENDVTPAKAGVQRGVPESQRPGDSRLRGNDDILSSERSSQKGQGEPTPVVDGPVLPQQGKSNSENRQPIEPSKAHALSELKFRLETCTACGLAQNRSRIVFSDGSMTAPIAFVGDSPSREEDLVSLPFVGERGHLLNKIILAIGQRRENSYLCNVVKCAPSQGKGPASAEIAACAPNLLEQLKLVSPRVIVAMGDIATGVLSGSNAGVAELRGQFFRWNDIPVMPTWSLNEMLATPALKREVWADMKQVKALLESSAP